MAIIYSYPTKNTPVGADMVLITDSESTNPANQTKQISITSLTALGTGVSAVTATSPIVASSSTGAVALSFNGGLNDLSDVTIDGTSSYFINTPSGLSGNPAGNVAVGSGSGNALTTGFNNVAMGLNAGDTIATGVGNVAIGPDADIASETDSYGVAVGSLAVAGSGGIAIGRGATAGDAELAIGNITLNVEGGNTNPTHLPIKINGVSYFIKLYT
jgi:hypothetical protein